MGLATHTELFSPGEWTDLQGRLRLSERQTQIARLVVQGKADKQIAFELGVSVSTVRTYLDRLFRKLDLNDRVELIVHMFRCVREQTLGRPVTSPGDGAPEAERAELQVSA